jgi:carbohydrate kinase (thermoresistant glucokinase family)
MNNPVQVVVMGVSGCGKTTVTKGLAAALSLEMVDGDDLHLPQSVSKMRSGQALEDTDRWPWLERIGRYLAQAPDNSIGRVVACSALKRAYRDQIRRMAPRARFVFLDGTPELIGQRLALRTGHYMPPDLLHSQFQTLERPDASESDVSTLSVAGTADQVLAAAVQRVRGFMSSEGQALELR